MCSGVGSQVFAWEGRYGGTNICRRLANIEIVNDQARVHHDVWRDGVKAPHMDPGISCPECEE